MISALTVFTGPMFAGKTEALIRAVRRSRDAELPIQVFVPASDARNGVGVVKSHGGLDLESLGINAWAVAPHDSVSMADRVRSGTRVVAIDEAQFFDSSIVEVCNTLADNGIRVLVAGLDMDFMGKPFGPIPALMSIAEHVTKVHAICMRCGNLAQYSFRKSDEAQVVLLGEKNLYEPLCRECYNKALNK